MSHLDTNGKRERVFIALDRETRTAIPTVEAAHHLGRRPQTLRKWAMRGGVGKLRPVNIHGRLLWPVVAIREAVGGQ
jgi:hypothetical protein